MPGTLGMLRQISPFTSSPCRFDRGAREPRCAAALALAPSVKRNVVRQIVLRRALYRRWQLVRISAPRRAIAGVAVARRHRCEVDGILGLAVLVSVGSKLQLDLMSDPVIGVVTVSACQLFSVLGPDEKLVASFQL